MLWVGFFIITDWEKLSSTLQWMGAIVGACKQLIKASVVIHMTPVHQYISCELKSCMFLINKSIPLGCLKIPIFIIMLSSESEEISTILKIMICRSSTVYKQNHAVRGLLWFLCAFSFWWHPFTTVDPLLSKSCDDKLL